MRRRLKPPDYAILTLVLTLLSIGLIMVYSASSVQAAVDLGDAAYYFKRQLVWSLIGVIGMFIAMNFPYYLLRNLARPIMAGVIFALILVIIPGVGISVNGSQRWLGFGFMNFQPSEAAKLGVVIFLAYWFSFGGLKRVRDFQKTVLPFLMMLGLVAALIMKQPDLGTTVAIGATAIIMLFLAGVDFRHLLLIGAASAPVLYVLIFMEEYRRQRFLAFLDPFADPLGTGYHIIQSLYALGSGGLFGVGLGQGKQKFFYLPERHTDFIFAVIGEELGLLGGALVILLFLLLVWRGFRVVITAPDQFAALLSAGIITMIAVQAVINIGVVTSSLPITGITLPFVSFGGSSLVFSLTGVGILMNISRYCNY